jgi:hypothetical protein
MINEKISALSNVYLQNEQSIVNLDVLRVVEIGVVLSHNAG